MGIPILVTGPMCIFISRKTQKYKPRYILLFGLLVSGLGHILMTVKILELSFVFRIIHEIADTCTFFYLYLGISKIFNLDRMGGNTGIIHFVTYVGTALGAIIFGTIGENYGYDMPIILSGCTTLLAFVISYRLIHHLDHKQ